MGSHTPDCAPPLLKGRQRRNWGAAGGARLAAEMQETGLMASGHNLIRGLWQERSSMTSSFRAIGVLPGRPHVWFQLLALSQKGADRLSGTLVFLCPGQDSSRSRWAWQMCYTPVLSVISSEETQPCVRIGFWEHCWVPSPAVLQLLSS